MKTAASPVDETSLTPFQQRVYAALREIPAGKVMTYAALGAKVGCRAPRAIGQALRRNPYAPEVPCHRVVRSDRALGGYQGRTRGEALARKRNLLESEGVTFEPGESAKVQAQCVLE
jgi:methylated-DNA-[protein]-cysteine S-methyltransferase